MFRRKVRVRLVGSSRGDDELRKKADKGVRKSKYLVGIIRSYQEKLEKIPLNDWPAIHNELSICKWPHELGEKVADTDACYLITTSLRFYIEDRCGVKSCMRHALVKSGQMSEQMFEDYWDSLRYQID